MTKKKAHILLHNGKKIRKYGLHYANSTHHIQCMWWVFRPLCPLPKSTAALENEINGIILQDSSSASLQQETMADNHEIHDVTPKEHKIVSPTIVYLDDDSDPSIASDLSVTSDIFDSEPEDKSNFTKGLRT